MLVSGLVYYFYLKKLKTDPAFLFREKERTQWFVLLIFASLFELALIVLATNLATRCNPNHKILAGTGSALFPELYLVWYVIQKYIRKKPNYCTF